MIVISELRTFQSLSRAVLDLANPRVISADEMPGLLGGRALHDSSGLGAFDQGVLDTLDVRAAHGCKIKIYYTVQFSFEKAINTSLLITFYTSCLFSQNVSFPIR